MTATTVTRAIHVRILERWTQLTAEDLAVGLKHRETFLDRLCHRHHIGLDEAQAQLHDFEQKNPELRFETS